MFKLNVLLLFKSRIFFLYSSSSSSSSYSSPHHLVHLFRVHHIFLFSVRLDLLPMDHFNSLSFSFSVPETGVLPLSFLSWRHPSGVSPRCHPLADKGTYAYYSTFVSCLSLPSFCQMVLPFLQSSRFSLKSCLNRFPPACLSLPDSVFLVLCLLLFLFFPLKLPSFLTWIWS